MNDEKYQERIRVIYEIKFAIIKRLCGLNNDLDFAFI
jgi:hypothetical protein